MIIKSPRYAVADGSLLLASIDGRTAAIPADPTNRHYRLLIDDGTAIAPYEPPPAAPYEVSKLAIVDRLEVAGLRAAAKAALAQDGLRQDRWDNSVAIRSDDADVRALLTAIGADPDVILAPA